MGQFYPDAFEKTLTRSYHYADPQLASLYQAWQAGQAGQNVAAPKPIPFEPSPLDEQEADSENFLNAGPGTYGAGADSGMYAKSDWATPQGQSNPALSQANPWGSPGGGVDPNESVANQPGYAGPNSAAGANPWSSTSLGFAGYSQPGSGTGGVSSAPAGGQASATGGYNSGGGGSSTTYMRPGSSMSGSASGNARGLTQQEVDSVMSRMDNMFTSLSSRAAQRADAAMANFRGDPAGAAARQFLTDTFTQGLTTSMADEYAGRLRNAQAARGMSFGGASSRDEAAMLVSMSEKRREALLPQMLKDSLDTAMLPAQLEAAYAANYGSAAKSAVNDASVYLDALKSRTATSGNSQYQAQLRDLFG
jgi:hypothetical protein